MCPCSQRELCCMLATYDAPPATSPNGPFANSITVKRFKVGVLERILAHDSLPRIVSEQLLEKSNPSIAERRIRLAQVATLPAREARLPVGQSTHVLPRVVVRCPQYPAQGTRRRERVARTCTEGLDSGQKKRTRREPGQRTRSISRWRCRA